MLKESGKRSVELSLGYSDIVKDNFTTVKVLYFENAESFRAFDNCLQERNRF